MLRLQTLMGISVFHTEQNKLIQLLEYFVMSHVLKWFPEAHNSQVSLPVSYCPPMNCISLKFILGISSVFLHVVWSPARL